MRILLTTLNSSYVHTSLALQSLKEAYANHQASVKADLIVREFTINEYLPSIADRIFFLDAEIIMFSCYIWNMKEIAWLGNRLKQMLPNCKIFLGGPEVGYTAPSALKKYPWADAIFCGEGENLLPKWIDHLLEGRFLNHQSILYREAQVLEAGPRVEYLSDLKDLPFPYSAEDLKSKKDRILYYESSRGCPYSCQYCLSSVDQPLRFLPLERVFAELNLFLQAQVKQVKFVDRTFNANRQRARQIWQFLLANDNHKTNFHFELAADLLQEEDIELLKSVPKGLFQFEIGVQSTNPKVLSTIQRVTDFQRISKMVRKLKDLGTIHLHLDLIAGLPYEDWNSLAKSFDDVHNLGADMLQLGFLKVLPGTLMEDNAEEYGLTYDPLPPYEVISTSVLSAQELLRVHHIETVFQRYGNSGRYENFLQAYLQFNPSAFQFYRELSEFFRVKGWLYQPAKERLHWQRLFDFVKAKNFDQDKQLWFLNKLKLDFCLKYPDQDLPFKQMQDQFNSELRGQLKKIWTEKKVHQNFGLAEEEKYKYRFAFFDFNQEDLAQEYSSNQARAEKSIWLFVYDYPYGHNLLSYGSIDKKLFD